MAATPALAALAAAGVAHEVVKFAHDPRQRSFGDEAVRALTATGDMSPGQICKTLIIAVPDGLAVAVLPVPTVVDSSAMAFEWVFCSAGRRGWDVAVSPHDLVRLARATTAEIQA